MKNMIIKDTVKEIKKSLGRFLSILAITALGVSFFAGIKVAPVYMRDSLDKYYDQQNFLDIRVVSTLGITDDDIEAIKSIEGVKEVSKGKSSELIASFDNRDIVVKAMGIPMDVFQGNNTEFINKPYLVEGRLPQNDKECVIETESIGELSVQIGSKIKVSTGTDTNLEEVLKNDEFTVVGTVQVPDYLSFEKGKSTIGKGDISKFILIDMNNFIQDIYTEARVTVEGATEMDTFSEEYFQNVGMVATKLEEVGKERAAIRHDEIIGEANKGIQEAEAELTKGKAEAEKQLNDAKNTIDSSRNKLVSGQEELRKKQEEFEQQMVVAESKIKEAESEINRYNTYHKQAESMYIDAEKNLKPEIDKINSKIVKAQGEKEVLVNRNKEIDILLNDSELVLEEREKLENEKNNNIVKITTLESEINLNSKILNEYNSGLKIAKSELESAKVKLELGKQELEKQKKSLVIGKEKAENEFKKAGDAIISGKAELQKGEAEYKKAKKEAEEKIKDGERELAEAKEKVAALKEPQWYVLDREKDYSYMSYKSSTDSIAAIAQVFPVFFFLVAALVCLTTMTRMVDEQRVAMGTLKALGYSEWKIASKYIIYAALASILGSLIGITVGMNLFPEVIFGAYGMMFNIPELIKEFNFYYASIATLAAVIITTLAAYLACNKELKEVPSVLMRPKAPPEGKRIFLERIGFIWNKLNFIGKVTARNILRYKKRFLMTVIGISGCTALLLTGFGIRDSIKVIVDRQFGEIFKYNMTISLEDETSQEDLARIDKLIASKTEVKDYINVETLNQKVWNDLGEKDATLLVTDDKSKLEDFITFRERKGKNKVSLQDDGVILTEKLASELKVNINDEINLKDGNGYSVKVKVTAIVENYTNHYVYMSEELYETLHNVKPKYTSIITINNTTEKAVENKLAEEFSKEEGISSTTFNSAISSSFNDTISNLNVVVIVMIISAGALAFVVLYNLTNVNISERLREIATIKVLGFYDNEVSSYVFRENFILTFIGGLVGLVLGVGLHKFIIVTTEMESFMFGRSLDTMSFIYAIVLTIVFAAIVNLAMYYKLKKIPMVESLKSVD